MAAERKTLTQLSVPICLETLFYMLSGMVDTLMLSSVSDQAVGAVGTANTYIGVFIIMFGVISSGMIAVMSQNIGAGRPGIAYQASMRRVPCPTGGSKGWPSTRRPPTATHMRRTIP